MEGDAFAVLAEPTRRQILSELRAAESSVGDLVSRLDVSQPTVSKHLKVLRAAGFVTSRPVAQRRMYRLEARGFEALGARLAPYLRLWSTHLDKLERHLDQQEEQ
jgi:DNA-binding transcriptional ArsR family regulator